MCLFIIFLRRFIVDSPRAGTRVVGRGGARRGVVASACSARRASGAPPKNDRVAYGRRAGAARTAGPATSANGEALFQSGSAGTASARAGAGDRVQPRATSCALAWSAARLTGADACRSEGAARNRRAARMACMTRKLFHVPPRPSCATRLDSACARTRGGAAAVRALDVASSAPSRVRLPRDGALESP